jgi:TonB family protein
VVVTQVVVDPEGCVVQLTILKAAHHRDLTEAALRATRWLVFEPAIVDGKPAATYWNLTTGFFLD